MLIAVNRTPQISIVLATNNRREVVLDTLRRIHEVADEAGGPCGAEIIVVDNASRDGTASAIRSAFPNVLLVEPGRNLGSCAKALGVDRSGGQYVVFLDDDSCPHAGSLTRMVRKFEEDGLLGAAGFIVHLPDGRRECSALPDVYIGCGVGFRRAALLEAGNLDRDLFMAAEEYDLSFRLIQAGWKIWTFTDLHVEHLKSPHARLSGRTLYYDTRNNLLVTARYLPDELASIYCRDWMQRYRWLAADTGQRWSYRRGLLAGQRRYHRERQQYAHWRLAPAACEQLFRYEYIQKRMIALAEQGIGKVLLADLGKNVYPFVRAARLAGMEILGIADDRFARSGRLYRGVPLVLVRQALQGKPPAVVIANTSPVHAETSAARWAELTDAPLHRWFGYDLPHESYLTNSARRERSAPALSCREVG